MFEFESGQREIAFERTCSGFPDGRAQATHAQTCGDHMPKVRAAGLCGRRAIAGRGNGTRQR
ncbi:hypothetical protein C7S14_2821 [Burkholderia cepacia]|nr:hypothetical protein C7S14_2821 [Burkholderia cepacia]